MASPSGKREERGVARHVIFVEQYPNGDIRTFPINASVLREIILHPDDIEQRIAAEPQLQAQWNSGDWKNNPSILLRVEADPSVKAHVLYGKYTGHEPPRPSLRGAPGGNVDVLQLYQRQRNLFTRTFWSDYAGYRDRLMALVAKKESDPPCLHGGVGPLTLPSPRAGGGRGEGEGGGRVCVLGAGNCNDIDLQLLARTFEQVTLADIDLQAVQDAVVRQGSYPNIAIAPLDVTGVLGILGTETPGKVGLAIDALRQRRMMGRRSPLGTFDVVISSCLLTQIIFNTRLAVTADDPAFPELLDALRLDHLHLLCELLAPGGLGILATDVISTDLAPYLPAIPEALFAEAATKLIDLGICMAGAHPWQIRRLMEGDEDLRRQLQGVQTLGPWRWTMRADLVYVVYTHLLHKRA
jgi:hypothetical protein